MANRTATVYLNCKVANGKWRFYPASKSANGRLEPGVAIVNNRRTDRDWRVKDKEDRFVPLPEVLVEELRRRRNGAKSNQLVFPNGQGRPEGHFLRKLQDIAERGSLEGKWELHKFRKTFATMHHETGVSPRTIQVWLGHSDLETTMAYLKGQDARTEHAQKAANSTFAAFD